jgi:hypothetical protein
MTPLIGAAEPVVDWDALGQVVLYSLGAGVGVTLCYALAIAGAARFGEKRTKGEPVAAAAYGVLMVFGLAATVVAVIAAIIVMTKKG